MVRMIKKRDGRFEPFDRDRIEKAIRAAFRDVGNGYTEEDIRKVVRATLYKITQIFGDDDIPSVEDISDVVEIMLMKHGYYDVAKAFILYRKKKAEERKEKMNVWGLSEWKDDPVLKKFSINALRVLASRYPIRDENGNIIELPSEIFKRVAVGVAIVEYLYDKKVFDKNGGHRARYPDKVDFEKLEELNVKVIGYKINKYMWQRLFERFKELADEGKMKISWDYFIEMIIKGRIGKNVEKYAEEWYNYMINQVFMPNTPTIVNAGRPLYMLSACFVIPIEDSLEKIMKSANDMVMIQRAGGGTGFDFSKLRPKGDIVFRTMGKSSGAVSFLRMMDGISEVIYQGGIRRGANMGVMQYWHPDIDEFIHAKEKNDGKSVLTTFNISVGLWEEFWEKLKNGEKFDLVNPRDGTVWGQKDARKFFEELAYMAWAKADPGVLYFDNHNKYNIMREKWGDITATNPCGEEALYPYESCNLLSINLWKFVKKDDNGKKYFDWDEYAKVIRSATKFLDDIIDINNYPIPEINDAVKKTRRVGLGFMGVADALFELGVPYNSKEGFDYMRMWAETNQYWSMKESIELAKERGAFPAFEDSGYVKGELPVAGYYIVPKEEWVWDWDSLVEDIKVYGIRNAFLTTAPPTGSVSMIADTSSGIEPIFALVYKKSVTVGDFYYVDPVFEKVLKERGLWSPELLQKIVDAGGSIQDVKEIPEDIRKVFITAMDIHWFDHILAQAAFQLWTDVSISKTINMLNNATVEDVKAAYLIGWLLGLKGVTIYRDGSLTYQVLSTDKKVVREVKMSDYAEKKLKELRLGNPWIDEIINWDEVAGFSEVNNRTNSSFDFILSLAGKEFKSNAKKESVSIDELSEEKIKEMLEVGTICPICYERDGKVVLLRFESGCKTCPECGYSACVVS